jgi:protein-tyrosine kinase
MNAHVNTADTSRSIGAILIDSGRLKPEDAERVLRVCREKGGRFGEVALQLKVITSEDVEFALARQFNYAYLQPTDLSVSPEVMAAFQPNAGNVENLRALRTQLMLRWFGADEANKVLSIVSTNHGDGRSWVAANLAVVFSQLGERTLLIDADLRKPRQHELFRLDNRTGLSAILSGRGSVDVIRRVTPLLGLSVLPAGAEPPNPQELLSRPTFKSLLDTLSESYDVILIDTPPAAEYADAQTITMRAGAGVVIARANVSSSSALARIVSGITESGGEIIGSIINKV